MYNVTPNGLVVIDTVLRSLEREFEDVLWDGADIKDYVHIEKEITRLKEAQQRGEVYDPLF